MTSDIVTGPAGLILLAITIFVFAVIFSLATKSSQDALIGTMTDFSVNTSIIAFVRSQDFTLAAASDNFSAVHANTQQFLAALPKPQPQFPEFKDRLGWGYHVLLNGEELDRIAAIPAVVKYTAKRVEVDLPGIDPKQELKVI
ncbi:MAG TPA: hypothetical protein VJK52_03270, partial [Candidatus Nanoarchaeia archaeon]|nr:hypothetical protein [Candidatus Nanoarchaeia archaeon]